MLSAGWQLGSVEGGAWLARRRHPVILGALPARQERDDGEGILTAYAHRAWGMGCQLCSAALDMHTHARDTHWAASIAASKQPSRRRTVCVYFGS